MLHCIVWYILTDVSEELTASIDTVLSALMMEAVPMKSGRTLTKLSSGLGI
jgi:hypothetical protein